MKSPVVTLYVKETKVLTHNYILEQLSWLLVLLYDVVGVEYSII